MDLLVEKFNFANNGDEFYTRFSDISKEIPKYNWNGMTVYCNCDDPTRSNFYKFFKQEFKKLGIKKLLATYKSEDPLLFEFDGVNEKRTRINSGYFQNNVNIIKICDAVVTNPPYSRGMMVEFIDMMLNSGKKFLLVGSLNIITKKKIFDYVKSGMLRVGYSSINTFEREDNSLSNSASCWWTNFDVNKPFLKPNNYYNENLYPKYDNYNAIDCSKTSLMPYGYNGVMGVPIRFITKYNSKQYKLIGILNHPRINGKNIMSRILIQNVLTNECIKIVHINEYNYKKLFKSICI